VVTRRPRDSRSITANCSAAFIGCTSVATNVNEPSITRDVSRASSVSSCSGPGNAHAPAWWRSGTCTEWKPARSASTPSSIIASIAASGSPSGETCVSIR
jgi:hypothetical protein